MTREEAIEIIVTFAEIRAQQWRGVADGEFPGDLVNELYEAREDEANVMASIIENALEVERATR